MRVRAGVPLLRVGFVDRLKGEKKKKNSFARLRGALVGQFGGGVGCSARYVCSHVHAFVVIFERFLIVMLGQIWTLII
jgi:hypothetical protein